MKIYLNSSSDSDYYISNYITDKELGCINTIICDIHYEYFEMDISGYEMKAIETKQEIDKYLDSINKQNIRAEYVNGTLGYNYIFYII